MNQLKYRTIIVIVLAIVISSLGFSVKPAQAASCNYYHYVRHGQSLSWIGAYYGVAWKDIASVNGIKSPYTVYTGQKLCIPYYGKGYTYVSYTPSWKNWNFSVIGVVEDTTVTIQTAHFPDNMLYTVEIGCKSCGTAAANVGNLDSDKGGSFKKVYTVPAGFAGVADLWIRVTQNNNGDANTQYFTNATVYGSGGKYHPDSPTYTYKNIPTIHINSVVRNSTVTFTTNNFPAGKTFKVLMGPMGSRGVNGYNAGTFNSGSGGKMTLTFNIPSQMYGARQIAIRTQSTTGGYYSYAWFYNQTAY